MRPLGLVALGHDVHVRTEDQGSATTGTRNAGGQAIAARIGTEGGLRGRFVFQLVRIVWEASNGDPQPLKMRGDTGDHCLLALESAWDTDEFLQQLVPTLFPGSDEGRHILIRERAPHHATLTAQTAERWRSIGSFFGGTSPAPIMGLLQG